ncbi:MAG: FHA domain-containing protein [Bacteroidaceae bacterium]|nr:FHA domain-containing protein [Bacteroidaceae bacterium]
MNNAKQVVCPNPSCRAILGIENVEGLEGKNIRCPRCEKVYPFTSFAPYVGPRVSPNLPGSSSSDETAYAGGARSDTDATRVMSMPDSAAIGGLILAGELERRPLRLGKNVVGRDATTSTADIRIPDVLGKRTMSRTHLLINVTRVGDTFKHQISLFPDGKKKNRTFVNQTELRTGDVVVLHDGDRITIDYQTLTFVQK